MSETFDTQGATRHLKAAGIAQPHAEAITDVVRDSRVGLATKADIAILSGSLEALRTETKTGMDALSDRIGTLQWGLGLIAAMVMAILVVMLTRAF